MTVTALKSAAESREAGASESPLASRAMLAGLHISTWGNRKFDRRVSEEVETQHEAEKGVGSYNKRLLAKDALKEIGGAVAEARDLFYKSTLPWTDAGLRILPSAMYFALVNDMRKCKARFERGVDALVKDYEQHVAEARKRLGKLFVEADYPPVVQLRARYSFEIAFSPLPAKEDFRADLPAEVIADIRQDIESRTARAFEDAVKDLWNRLYEGVEHVRDRLKAFHIDGEGKVHHPFRDSMFLHLRELCDMLPRLNVTGDAKLESMRLRLVESLASATLDPQELRYNPAERDAALKAADDLLASMSGFV